MERRRVMVSLVTPPLSSAADASREARIDFFRRATEEAKKDFARWLDGLRGEDPYLTYRSKDDLFPIVFVDTTDAVVARLKASEKVAGVETTGKAIGV